MTEHTPLHAAREQTALYKARKAIAKLIPLALIAGTAFGGYKVITWGLKETAENKIRQYYEQRAAAAEEERKQLALQREHLEPLIRQEYNAKFLALGADYTNKAVTLQKKLEQDLETKRQELEHSFKEKAEMLKQRQALHETRAHEYQILIGKIREQYFGSLVSLTSIADSSAYTPLERTLMLQTHLSLSLDQLLLDQNKFFDASIEKKARLVAVRNPRAESLSLAALNPTNHALIEMHLYTLPPSADPKKPWPNTVSTYLTNVVPASSLIFSAGRRATLIHHSKEFFAYHDGKLVSSGDLTTALENYKAHAQQLLEQFAALYGRGPYPEHKTQDKGVADGNRKP